MRFFKTSHPEIPEGTLTVPEGAGESALRAVKAFEQGNFALARKLAAEVLAADPGNPDRIIALDLKKRMGTDPVVLVLAGACIMALLFITLWAITHSH